MIKMGKERKEKKMKMKDKERQKQDCEMNQRNLYSLRLWSETSFPKHSFVIN